MPFFGGILAKRNSEISKESLDLETRKIFEKIFALIRAQTQVDVSNYKITTVSRRIERQMRANKIANLEEFSKFLEGHPEATKALCDDLFIHVTEFFRDPDSFAAVKADIFPKLVKNRMADVPLRIWIPGCSSGEEVYSIAIALLEYLSDAKEAVPLKIFATDIAEPAVEKARSGFYGYDEVEGLTDVRLGKYFDKVKDGYRVKKTIRDACIFSRHDLIHNPPFAKMDLISCRNVLIYFDSDLQKQVMPIFHYSLNTNGYLWLGRSEGPLGITRLFSVADKVHKIFTKNSVPTPMNFRFPMNRPVDKTSTNKKANLFANVLDQHKEIDKIGLARYVPAGVLVNSELEVIQVRGHTSPFLELPSGNISNNLMKLLRPELLPGVRMAIQTALKSNAPSRKDGLTYAAGRGRRKIDVEVIPANAPGSEGEIQFLIFFEEHHAKNKSPAPKVERKLKAKRSNSKDAYIAELLHELDSMREYQQSLAEGFEATQEELTSSNEELQSALEEYQSTNEELETAKEEMQATNEELATVNDELQHRNEELGKSEERFRLLVEAVKDYAIFMLDPEGTIVSWNEGARRLKGYEPSEILGSNFSRFYLPEDIRRQHPQHELEVARKVGRYEEEGWRIRKDGSRFWANVVISRIDGSDGNIIGFSKVTRDLTERKRAEESLREANETLETKVQERTARLRATEDQLRQFVERSPYAVAMLDRQMRYIFASQQWVTDYRLPAGEYRGKGHYEIFPEIPDRWRDVHRRCLNGATERSDAEPFVRADGKVDWIRWEIRPWHDRSGGVGGLLIFTENITERLKSEAQLQLISNTLPAFVTYIDQEERYRFANTTYLEWVGKTREQVMGRTAREILGETVYAKAHPAMLKALNGEAVAYDLPWTSAAGGAERTFRIRYTPDVTPEKVVNGYVMHGQDVTDLRKAIGARDEFLSIASHELKTPLTSLKLQLQMGEQSLKASDVPPSFEAQMADAFSMSIRQINSMTELVEVLLDISRIQTGKFEMSLSSFDLSELVREIVDRFSEQLKAAQCTIETDLEDNLWVNWDRNRIAQVITNLISNAIKHAPKSEIRVSATKTAKLARLVVQDFGPGIPKDKQAKIFDRFERADATINISGMGLGLYIVKKIVEAHKGAIRVDSELGRGSEFTAELPISLKSGDWENGGG